MDSEQINPQGVQPEVGTLPAEKVQPTGEAKPTQELAKRESTSSYLSTEFKSGFSEQWKMASTLAGANLLPKDINTPEKLFLLLQQGKELGLQPMQSINNIYVVNSRTSITSKMMLALIIKAGIKFAFVEWTDKICKMNFNRDGWEMEISYTFEEAEKAGLVFKDNWKKYPKEMLKSRCISRAVGLIAPDIIGGMYDETELRETFIPEASGTPTQQIVTPTEEQKSEKKDADIVGGAVNDIKEQLTKKAGEAKTPRDAKNVQRMITNSLDSGLINEEEAQAILSNMKVE